MFQDSAVSRRFEGSKSNESHCGKNSAGSSANLLLTSKVRVRLSDLSRSGISALLFGAQRQVEVQLDLDFGQQRIGPALGRYRYNRADLPIYAKDLKAREEPNLTWEMVLEAIDLVRFCTVGRDIYLEMEAGIYYTDVELRDIVVKLARIA